MASLYERAIGVSENTDSLRYGEMIDVLHESITGLRDSSVRFDTQVAPGLTCTYRSVKSPSLRGSLRQTFTLDSPRRTHLSDEERAHFLYADDMFSLRVSEVAPWQSGYRDAYLSVAVDQQYVARPHARLLLTRDAIRALKASGYRWYPENEYVYLSAFPGTVGRPQQEYYLSSHALDEEKWPTIDPELLRKLGIWVPQVEFHHPLREPHVPNTLMLVGPDATDYLHMTIAGFPFVLDHTHSEQVKKHIHDRRPLITFGIHNPSFYLTSGIMEAQIASDLMRIRQFRQLD